MDGWIVREGKGHTKSNVFFAFSLTKGSAIGGIFEEADMV